MYFSTMPRTAMTMRMRPMWRMMSAVRRPPASAGTKRETPACPAAPALPANAGSVTVSHPVFGRNTITNIFGLMAAHEERHGTQISGLMSQSGFPAGVRL